MISALMRLLRAIAISIAALGLIAGTALMVYGLSLPSFTDPEEAYGIVSGRAFGVGFSIENIAFGDWRHAYFYRLPKLVTLKWRYFDTGFCMASFGLFMAMFQICPKLAGKATIIKIVIVSLIAGAGLLLAIQLGEFVESWRGLRVPYIPPSGESPGSDHYFSNSPGTALGSALAFYWAVFIVFLVLMIAGLAYVGGRYPARLSEPAGVSALGGLTGIGLLLILVFLLYFASSVLLMNCSNLCGNSILVYRLSLPFHHLGSVVSFILLPLDWRMAVKFNDKNLFSVVTLVPWVFMMIWSVVLALAGTLNSGRGRMTNA